MNDKSLKIDVRAHKLCLMNKPNHTCSSRSSSSSNSNSSSDNSNNSSTHNTVIERESRGCGGSDGRGGLLFALLCVVGCWG